ncbi:RBBP9/YdeN family alpha/beta hydrolase [Macromonas nakdongensis]|uniref:RBBP9/YdeN family alpha/beta hydrolase n=1 Tax=Macromonas nakdongensis TaxID=1843082 RepID=UPI000C34F618|nr:alpha/beta fold hydrolase [Macromonas nakdongensis]
MIPPKLPPVLIVPGLRDHVADHWQTHLERALRAAGRPVVAVPPMGRSDLDCQARVDAIEQAAASIDGPFVLVAHSGGCVMVAHWAARSRAARRVVGALLATPPDFDRAMPEGYPTLAQLDAAGWLPVPRQRLPFRSCVLLSHDDPLGSFPRIGMLALDWDSHVVDLGRVGHLNPASGYGDWPEAMGFVDRVSTGDASFFKADQRG